MSIADAEKIEEHIATRETESRRQQDEINRETDPAERDRKIREKQEYDAETAGMRLVAQNLRQNRHADARAVIPRIRDVEAVAVRELEIARDEARRNHQGDRVRQLERQILLARRTMDGKSRCMEHLAMAPGAEDPFKYAMKLTLHDGFGRPVAQLAFNLGAGEPLVLVDPGHPIPAAETTKPGEAEERSQARS